MFDLGVDEKTAREEVKHILGLSRWVREASPEWLGRLRIDIYLPDLKLAFEHQGEQHYRPITVLKLTQSCWNETQIYADYV